MATITRDPRADIVAFGDHGVWTVVSHGDGAFQEPKPVVNQFDYVAAGWRVDKHPRLLADTTGGGKADIVGFGNDGVWVARM
ncbi:hypothetical protein [Streptomyces spectabilis]|uniref:VCBS repeat-containing protein n=1 Tax=Streptomyces spectabilis TaxID=68270 RepID=A0A516R1E7_STRST|nr:hypothetical protein [Streptomyces spectabilis]QDQ09481.1 hypothetical protein FH965_02000 [Streptomyces spectabilis]